MRQSIFLKSNVFQAVLLSTCVASGSTYAQNVSITVNPERNIEQSINQLQSHSGKIKPLANVDVLGLEQTESIDKLLSVETDDGPLKAGILNYWASHLGKAVSAEELQSFNGWLFDESRREGYLSYA